ncbi:hypothetical protein IJJ36_01760 [Candidatus Saccharibacteria bacterium]|nr:hypothetical protein [Candidatus Saccharibacteria bacterium]
MVKHVKVILGSLCILVAISLVGTNSFTSATEYNTNFQVNVRDSLTVSISTPSEWASGTINTFLRNKINVNATSNIPNITVSMSTKTASTSLTNMSKDTETLPTLAYSVVRSSFPANRWGYSVDDTDAGSNSSYYLPLVGSDQTPITVGTVNTTTLNKNIFFGAKSDITQASGTYAGIVVINVVTGVIDNSNPANPSNPAQPSNSYEVATHQPSPAGNSSDGATVYTYRRTSGSGSSAINTITSEVSGGDNVSAYSGYTPPQGVTNVTTSSINSESSLATGLAATASVAAASGIFFFVLAKRRDDDDDEEEQQQ